MDLREALIDARSIAIMLDRDDLDKGLYEAYHLALSMLLEGIRHELDGRLWEDYRKRQPGGGDRWP